MPVGAQMNMLEAFIRNQSEFTVDVEPDQPSGRVLLGDELKRKLKERRHSTSMTPTMAASSEPSSGSTASSESAQSSAGDPIGGSTASPAQGLGHFLTFAADPVGLGAVPPPERNLIPLPPWTRRLYTEMEEMHMNLHEEIVDWLRYMQPRPAEVALRHVLIRKIVEACADLFPEAKVHVFGSMQTGLLLPASDVDLCVDGVTSCKIQEALERISTRLEMREISLEKPRIIANAKVPIIKFTDRLSRLECDISINAIAGRQNTSMVKKLLDKYPQARPLVLIIKTYLRQRGLNEVFSGGLSSYSISLMAIHMLQMFYSDPRSVHNRMATSLGKLLIDFFHLYGWLFNYDAVAISVRDDGQYLSKQYFDSRPGAKKRGRGGYLNMRIAIEDPQNVDNDVSGGSWKIRSIKKAFGHAFMMLTDTRDFSHVRETRHVEHPRLLLRPTLLNRVLGIDTELLIRRDGLEAAYEN
eukprot:CAMPEP_0174378894 /NCGR_PEP_ID=MMETSP0811_2-20130205/122348_1 /TAXON_ID=73025 ORGANISM="Eutreptiella gymnastica-like, Strain CCMP1594" /NCGR_SAMPLE_ID=MMETSP0811_2 /ASSEMBLY_ACC=CAM_ASM_000667 /LENGTH=468 /DNA_ID=CAMNT_0015531251 /DNA_START=39 /DNA_END=1442 /DNA_ORIENTATION=-